MNERTMIIDRRISNIDASRTYTLATEGKISEAIYFKSNSGRIVGLCVSTQFGCQMQCQFCANKNSNFDGNIEFNDLKDIVTIIENDISKAGLPLPNTYDLKGVGEPLLNFDNIMAFYYYIKQLHPSVTVNLSTCGTVNSIYRLADIADCNIKLFWSMHSPLQNEREIIMPSAKKNKLPDIIDACIYYAKKKNCKVTASYLLLGNNGTKAHLNLVTELLSPELFEIEVLLYNQVEGSSFVRPSDIEAYEVRDYFREKGYECNVIISKGRDTGGGCGQLRNKFEFGKADFV